MNSKWSNTLKTICASKLNSYLGISLSIFIVNFADLYLFILHSKECYGIFTKDISDDNEYFYIILPNINGVK